MQLTIGSNRLRNTDGIISVRGKRQIFLEWGPFDSELLLTMDLYSAGGEHIARLRRNRWTFNDRERFNFVANARGFSLVDAKSSQVVLEARVVGGNSVVITQGAFHCSTGDQIEINVENWHDVTDSRTSAERATRSTNPPFAAEEIAAIREAVTSSHETVECPRCGHPLTRDHIPGATQLDDTHLVSCVICIRNLVVRRHS
jgi:hypothetical protein